MREFDLLLLLFFLLPAIIVGLIAFFAFKMHTDNEEKRRRFLIRLENQKTALPVKLQAYERMALFLERISPGKLLTRIKPAHYEKEHYQQALIQTIEQEYEHNLAQQIYLSTECWNVIKTSKNATIGAIRRTAAREDVDTADKLREVILTSLMDQSVPTDAAMDFLKNEVRKTI